MSLPPATGAVELASFKKHVSRLLAEKKRLDGRPFDSIRAPRILHDTNGGARVAGALASILYTDDTGTCLNCTVRGAFGPPPAHHPEEGRLTVDISAPFFQNNTSGKIEEPLRSVAWFVRSTIISCMDLTELSLISGEACWVLQIELVVLNADGGLRAAALHASAAALHNVTLPKARLPSGDMVESMRPRFHRIPVAATIGVFTGCSGGEMHMLLDTNAAEESVVDGLVTVVLDESDGIVTLLQHGKLPLVVHLLVGAVEVLGSYSAMLRSAILNSGASPSSFSSSSKKDG